VSAKELHRKYIALVQPDMSDPDDLQGLTLADMMQLIQNIAADPNATYCSTDGPTRVKPSPFAWSEHAITMGRMELQHSRPTARKPSTISYA
jgi:hypothetical protein